MLKIIIEQWIGEEEKEHRHGKDCKNYDDCVMFSRHTRSYNQVISDLKSRIPELEEMIVGEIEKLLLQQEAKLDNCNKVDWQVEDECYKRNQRARDWNEIIRRIINSLK